jgi:hypothetical protein
MRRSSKPLPKDSNKRAYEIFRLSTEEPDKKPLPQEKSEISKYLSEIGRKGGLIGGKARAAKLTVKQRKEISQKAAKARWSKTKKEAPQS